MSEVQQSNCAKKQTLSPSARIVCGAVFCVFVGGAAILWASGQGYIQLGPWLGVCGFKQRFGLPCPGCGWTTAGQAFFTGHIFAAFHIQPAAWVFCVVLIFAAFFALLGAGFGINFRFLKNLFHSAYSIGILCLSAAVVVMAGWAVTLIRSILEHSGH